MPKGESPEALVMALVEAWDMERHALSLLQPQMAAAPDNTAVAEALQRHVWETQEQLRRLETILSRLGEAVPPSSEGSPTLAFRFPVPDMGDRQSFLAQWWLTSISFENFEAAVYVALLALAEEFRCDLAVRLLKQSLLEEYQMAADLEGSIDELAFSSGTLLRSPPHQAAMLR